MYTTTIVASAVALAGTALAQSLGSAVVVNQCNYPVYLQNTPAAGGGFSAISQTLQTGDQYSQVWTELTNSDGWSLKLSQEEGAFEENVLQYEYTWHGWDGAWGGTIWFDLSAVNGNPWDGNWEVQGDNGCTPRQAAYQYSTDDAFGMQDCQGGSSVTVTLCSGNGGSSSGSGSGSGSSSSSSGSSPSSQAQSSVPQAPATSSVAKQTSTYSAPQTTATSSDFNPFNFGGGDGPVQEANKADNANSKTKATPTTLATVVTSAANRGGVTVTEVATQVVTNFVTATAEAGNAKRHEHLHRHAHHNF